MSVWQNSPIGRPKYAPMFRVLLEVMQESSSDAYIDAGKTVFDAIDRESAKNPVFGQLLDEAMREDNKFMMFLADMAMEQLNMFSRRAYSKKLKESPPAIEDHAHEMKPVAREELLHLAKIARADKLAALDHMARRQDIDPSIFDWQTTPICVLFISHRWISAHHADPEGQQLRSIQKLMKAIELLASVWDKPLLERIALVPSLRVHGNLQAARILARIAGESGTIDASILSRIGVWYDYMCLPQKDCHGTDDRSDDDRKCFRQGLKNIPVLTASSDYIISLREENDDYIERAWCVSELCFADAKYPKNTIVLREDLVGERIVSDLLQADAWAADSHLCTLREIIDSWSQSQQYTGNTTLEEYYAFIETSEAERLKTAEEMAEKGKNSHGIVKWPVPFLISPRAPNIFPTHSTFLMRIRQSLARAPYRNIDIFMSLAMREDRIICRNVNDYVRCGLHIMLSRTRSHAPWRKFFADCLQRLSEGKPLVLATYVNIENDSSSAAESEYAWETDPRIIFLHDTATHKWKCLRDQQRNDELNSLDQLTVFLNSVMKGLRDVSVCFRSKWITLSSLSNVIENALQFDGVGQAAPYETRFARLQTGLVLLYAATQGIEGLTTQESRERREGSVSRGDVLWVDEHNLSAFFLTLLERLPVDENLNVSHYDKFQCTFVS